MHSLLLLLWLSSPTTAQKTYHLALDTKPKTGQKSRLQEASHMKVATRVNGQPVPSTEETKEFEATEVVLKSDQQGNADLQRTFQKAQRTLNGQTTRYGFEGRTVSMTQRKGQKPTFTLVGDGELSADDLEGLKGSFSYSADSENSPALDPPHPVRVGESWYPAGVELKRAFEADLEANVDASKSTARFTLKGVEKRDGGEFANVASKMELVLHSLAGLHFETPMSMTMTLDMDVCIDGSSEDGVAKLTVLSRASGPATVDGHTMTIDLESSADSTQTRTTIE
jgi:hypothetical protein